MKCSGTGDWSVVMGMKCYKPKRGMQLKNRKQKKTPPLNSVPQKHRKTQLTCIYMPLSENIWVPVPPEATETDAEKVKVTYDPKQLFYQSHTRGGWGARRWTLWRAECLKKISSLCFLFYPGRTALHSSVPALGSRATTAIAVTHA